MINKIWLIIMIFVLNTVEISYGDNSNVVLTKAVDSSSGGKLDIGKDGVYRIPTVKVVKEESGKGLGSGSLHPKTIIEMMAKKRADEARQEALTVKKTFEFERVKSELRKKGYNVDIVEIDIKTGEVKPLVEIKKNSINWEMICVYYITLILIGLFLLYLFKVRPILNELLKKSSEKQ